MTLVTRTVSDVLTIMRRAISRSANDSQATDDVLLRYINDFIALKAPLSMKLANQFSTLTFTIDGTTEGIYTFNDLGADTNFVDVGTEAFIYDPNATTSNWSTIGIYRDPESFYYRWGVNNETLLTTGMPTEVLFYDNQFVFRTIPDKQYSVKMYGYKFNGEYPEADSNIQFPYWLRWISYGAALDFATDFNYAVDKLHSLTLSYQKERKLLLLKTHGEITKQRCIPSY